MKRIETGHYESLGGRVIIRSIKEKQNKGKDKTLWEIILDGSCKPMCYETKKEAIQEAERLILEKYKKEKING